VTRHHGIAAVGVGQQRRRVVAEEEGHAVALVVHVGDVLMAKEKAVVKLATCPVAVSRSGTGCAYVRHPAHAGGQPRPVRVRREVEELAVERGGARRREVREAERRGVGEVEGSRTRRGTRHRGGHHGWRGVTDHHQVDQRDDDETCCGDHAHRRAPQPAAW